MKPLLLLFACLLSFSVPGHADSQETAVDARQVEGLIEAFRTSIIDKDKARFVELFLDGGTTWQSVKSNDTLQRIRQQQPEAIKVRIDPGSNHLSFIDGIVASKERQEEKFWNVKIETDGDIASVYFDYSFHSGDRETNHGKEAWHLVNTEAGWKIISVVYSVIRNAEPEQ